MAVGGELINYAQAELRHDDVHMAHRRKLVKLDFATPKIYKGYRTVEFKYLGTNLMGMKQEEYEHKMHKVIEDRLKEKSSSWLESLLKKLGKIIDLAAR